LAVYARVCEASLVPYYVNIGVVALGYRAWIILKRKPINHLVDIDIKIQQVQQVTNSLITGDEEMTSNHRLVQHYKTS
jgi:hypothetical protein